MTKKITPSLKFGWTTGTCATAACFASYQAMMSGEFPKKVKLLTPSGKIADLEIAHCKILPNNAFQAGIIKDAGDDPDVTHGAMIIATIKQGLPNAGVSFKAGEGVGFVTKEGLPIPVGEPAINPVPREMMRKVIAELAASLNGPTDIEIEISVPNGAEIAKQTWNSRLGIIGGLSILGTSGVVRPFSCSAWIASIHRGIDVGRAEALPHMIASTGSTSEKCAREIFNLPETSCLDMGDFIGGMLKYLRRNPIPSLTIAGGFAKMVKFAQGANDLHSARSQVNFAELIKQAETQAFIPVGKLADIQTALEALQRLNEDESLRLTKLVANQAKIRAIEILRSDQIKINIMLVTRVGVLLHQTGFNDAA